MTIDELAAFLATEGFGTVATDIFTGELPLDKTDVISLEYSLSPKPDTEIPYYDQNIDIWGRYKKSTDGYDAMKAIFDFIHQKHHYIVGESYIYKSFAFGLVEDFGRDAERRHLFKISLGFIYRRS